LLSVEQVTEELQCCALMYPSFCLFQDILTKEIIGHGTKRKGLYYIDDLSCGKATNIHLIDNKEWQIWLWHNRLGHPSFWYLHCLFPELFTKFREADFQCKTCIKAKSHRVLYSISLNQSATPFAIVHTNVWGLAPITISSEAR